MPTNITIKNIPDQLYERLKTAAEIHHRSLNSEVIACLERVLFPLRMSAEERLERAHVLRQDIAQYGIEAGEIDDAIEQGRP
jgi:plasmid stability protein